MNYYKINFLLTKIILSKKIRKRADRYFNRTLLDFKKEHKRKPNRNDLFLLVVKTSHRAVGIKKLNGDLDYSLIKVQVINEHISYSLSQLLVQ